MLPIVNEPHAVLGSRFELIDSLREQHNTPAVAVQAFQYCLCRLSTSAAAAV